MSMDKAQVSAADICTGFDVVPIKDGVNEGAQGGGWPVIWGGDSGSPAFILDASGQTVFVGLMNGGMQVNVPEMAALNAQLTPHGYSVTHVQMSSRNVPVPVARVTSTQTDRRSRLGSSRSPLNPSGGSTVAPKGRIDPRGTEEPCW